MKKICLGLCGVAAALLSGCAAGPQMQMALPGDSAEYNGYTVRVHYIDQGDLGKANVAAASAEEESAAGNLKDLMVDSLPKLEYHIGPLDMVQIVVWEHPELTSPMGQYQPAGQKVTTDGKLFYPYAGELNVAGLTAQELRLEITKRLSDKILNDPQVDVRVTGYNGRKAFVSGAVNKPGAVGFDEKPMTLPDAISLVGGFDEYADPSAMQFRRDGKVYSINYLDAFQNNLALEKILLRPGDQIFVPALKETQKSNKVYVLGEVGRVGTVDVNNGKLSLVEALASSGGLNALNADSRSVYVIRNSNETTIDVYLLNAKNAMALAMAERFNLSSHDVVYVDASGLATWNRIISLIAPTGALLNNAASTGRNIQLMSSGQWGR